MLMPVPVHLQVALPVHPHFCRQHLSYLPSRVVLPRQRHGGTVDVLSWFLLPCQWRSRADTLLSWLRLFCCQHDSARTRLPFGQGLPRRSCNTNALHSRLLLPLNHQGICRPSLPRWVSLPCQYIHTQPVPAGECLPHIWLILAHGVPAWGALRVGQHDFVRAMPCRELLPGRKHDGGDTLSDGVLLPGRHH